MRPKPLLVAVLARASRARWAPRRRPTSRRERLLEDGRAYLAQGKQKQALDNFNIVVSSFPNTDSVGERAARDRAATSMEVGRRRREGARRLRAGDQAATRASDAAPGRLLLPGPADAQPRHHAAPRSRTRSRSSRASRRSTPASAWVPRALAAAGARAPSRGPLRRGERPQPPRRRSSTRPPTRRRAPSTRSAARSRSRASRGSRWRSSSRSATASRRATGPSPRCSAPRRSTGCSAAPSRAFALDPAFSAGAGDMLKDVRALLIDADRLALDRVGEDQERAGVRRRRQAGRRLRRRGPAHAVVLARGRAGHGFEDGGAGRAQGHPDLHDALREARRAAQAGREDSRRGRSLRAGPCWSPTRSARRSCTSTPRASTRAPSPADATRPSAR